jgi:hypothetical protein
MLPLQGVFKCMEINQLVKLCVTEGHLPLSKIDVIMQLRNPKIEDEILLPKENT